MTGVHGKQTGGHRRVRTEGNFELGVRTMEMSSRLLDISTWTS